MGQIKFLMAIASFAVTIGACGSNLKNVGNKMEQKKTKTVLVTYFSATGTTKAVAQKLAKEADADLFEIVPERAYTDADLNWQDKQSRSSVEMANKKSRPAIKVKMKNWSQYKVVYVGFPIWWYTCPTIINTFLEQYPLKGKTMIPFCTSGGSTIEKACRDLKTAYPQAVWKKGVTNPSDKDLKDLVEANK